MYTSTKPSGNEIKKILIHLAVPVLWWARLETFAGWLREKVQAFRFSVWVWQTIIHHVWAWSVLFWSVVSLDQEMFARFCKAGTNRTLSKPQIRNVVQCRNLVRTTVHYRLSSIKGVPFRFANFASHFISVQIFQIDFPLILSAYKYFR